MSKADKPKTPGVDWLVGPVVDKQTPRAARTLAPQGYHVGPEELDAVVAQFGSGARKIRDGVKSIAVHLEEIKAIGLTGELLVLMVRTKAPRLPNGNYLGNDGVEAALKGLFLIGEFVK